MPRGRPKKRLLRMHAAVDAMEPYGFSEERTIKVVKELLKEYGGDDQWAFIEDSSYNVLLEALLLDVQNKDQEEVAQDGNLIMNNPSDDAETSTRASDAQQDERPQEHAPTDIVAVAQPTSPELAAADGTGWKDILPDQTCENVEETDNLASRNDEDLPTEIHPPRISATSLDVIPSTPAADHSQRHCHCNGWIESDDDGEDDFIFLASAPGVLGPPRDLSKSPSDVKGRQRMSRWDLRPEDP